MEAISGIEATAMIPDLVVRSIARVESGRPGVSPAWPWTVNAEGRGYYMDSKDEAVSLVRSLRARGIKSIDVGCMQINLMYHPDAFKSLEDAFDPLHNVDYAVRFLRFLHQETGTWENAVSRYHSGDPERGNAYRARVLAASGRDLDFGVGKRDTLVLTLAEARQGDLFRQALLRQKNSFTHKESENGKRPQRIVIIGHPFSP